MEGQGWGPWRCPHPCSWGRNPAVGTGARETEARFQKIEAQRQDGRGRLVQRTEGREWVRTRGGWAGSARLGI